MCFNTKILPDLEAHEMKYTVIQQSVLNTSILTQCLQNLRYGQFSGYVAPVEHLMLKCLLWMLIQQYIRDYLQKLGRVSYTLVQFYHSLPHY